MKPRRPSVPAVGLIGAAGLMVAAMVVPVAAHWDVRIGLAPLFAHWMPRVGPGSLIAVSLGLSAVGYAERLSQRLSWGRLVVASCLGTLVWAASLAWVDGGDGLRTHNDTDDMVRAARATTSVPHMLHDFVDRIPLGPNGWETHVAGHPAGALLLFVFLVRLGLGGSLAVGIFITLVASTIPAAVLTTLKALGAERHARSVAPFLCFTPAVIWEVVSADAIYACLAAWAIAALTLGAVRRSIAWCCVSGALFGVGVEMSYGLPLMATLAVAVLIIVRTHRPIGWSLAAALLVIAMMWLGGFSLWDAYPAIHQRYWAGVASQRPATYWLWGDLAALCFSAGPILGSCVASWIQTIRVAQRSSPEASLDSRVVVLLGGAALLSVIAADISLMSKAEVERIWLPFIPWLLTMCALLPQRWKRPALLLQVLSALLVQHLLLTGW